MSQSPEARKPRGKLGKVLLNLLITLVVGAVYFYVTLPALNFQSGDFYSFLLLLCIVYVVCALITSGYRLDAGDRSHPGGQIK